MAVNIHLMLTVVSFSLLLLAIFSLLSPHEAFSQAGKHDRITSRP